MLGILGDNVEKQQSRSNSGQREYIVIVPGVSIQLLKQDRAFLQSPGRFLHISMTEAEHYQETPNVTRSCCLTIIPKQYRTEGVYCNRS